MRLSSLDAWRLRDEAEPRAGRHPLERVASVVKRLSRPRRSVGRTWSQFNLDRPEDAEHELHAGEGRPRRAVVDGHLGAVLAADHDLPAVARARLDLGELPRE